jgi:hypothetical protein
VLGCHTKCWKITGFKEVRANDTRRCETPTNVSRCEEDGGDITNFQVPGKNMSLSCCDNQMTILEMSFDNGKGKAKLL